MPANLVKTPADEKRWNKAKEMADARVRDGNLEKDSDQYWAFTNSRFQKMKNENTTPNADRMIEAFLKQSGLAERVKPAEKEVPAKVTKQTPKKD